jgi:hypothetical protein
MAGNGSVEWQCRLGLEPLYDTIYYSKHFTVQLQ